MDCPTIIIILIKVNLIIILRGHFICFQKLRAHNEKMKEKN